MSGYWYLLYKHGVKMSGGEIKKKEVVLTQKQLELLNVAEKLGYPRLLGRACVKEGLYRLKILNDTSGVEFTKAIPISADWVVLEPADIDVAVKHIQWIREVDHLVEPLKTQI